MTPEIRNPAPRKAAAGLPQTVQLGGERSEDSPRTLKEQASATVTGTLQRLEMEAVQRARQALLHRGAERLQALALAAVYARAAETTQRSLILGGAR